MFEHATVLADWLVVLPVVLSLSGAAILLMLRRFAGFAAIVVALAVLAVDMALLLRVYALGPQSMTMGNWLPPFGISLTVDIFSASFAFAAALTTLAVLVFALHRPRGADREPSFFPLVLLLLAGTTGAFLTGDLFNLYVWFEVILIASFGLLTVGGTAAELDATVKYGFLNFLATALFLLALGLLYGALGTLNMADIVRVAPGANPAVLSGIAALLLLAFGMKAAAFPLNAWLPASYHAVQPAVAALLAGLPTKVGAYAMLRTLVALMPSARDWLEPVLVCIAVATLLLAPLGAIAETNLRRALGFVLIGGIGAILVGIALGTEGGAAGAGAYILQAILSVTALYLVAGLVEQTTGQTDTRHMGGLYASSTPLSILFLVLALGSAGVPPLLGFWPKLILLEASFAAGTWWTILLAVALLVNSFLTLIALSRLWAHIFWRPADTAPITGLPIAEAQKLALAAITTLVVTAGLWPDSIFDVAQTGAADLMNPSRYVAAVGLAEGAP